MTEVINKGDVVELKSGGPKMTVVGIDDDTIWCEWFDTDKVTSGAFDAITLKSVGEDQ